MAASGAESGCYVYRPAAEASDADRDDDSPSGITPQRLEAFNRVWEPTRKILDGVLASSDAGSVNRICAWLSSLTPHNLDRIPTGLITTTTASSLFDKVSSQADDDILIISVPAAQCSNLKSALKCIVSAVSSQLAASTRRTLLNYDLEAVRSYLEGSSSNSSEQQRFSKVLLYFINGESLHGGVLSELIDVLDSWRDRIPFATVFETAVGVEIFQEKLTRSALGALRGEAFSTASAADVVEAIFRAAATSKDQRLWMGANPAALLVERQAEHLQSAQSFVAAIRYMYMLHFYRNPLSAMLDGGMDTDATADLLDAARHCKSFQAHIAALRKQKKTKDANRLAKDDAALFQLLNDSIDAGHDALAASSDALRVLAAIHDVAPPSSSSSSSSSNNTHLSWSKLYVHAMSGQLLDSTLTRNLLHAARSLPSSHMSALLTRLSQQQHIPDAAGLLTQLEAVITTHCPSPETAPLRSEHDKAHETTRTAVVGKKISLARQRTSLSAGDTAYSALVAQVDKMLVSFLRDRLAPNTAPRALLFHEAFVFDLRVPLREALAPRPRKALDTALTVPGAYLACDCCDPAVRALSPSQPPTAVLYQLYLESGATVNIADLWAAFDAIVPAPAEEEGGGGDADADAMNVDGVVDEQKIALFYQALAELSYLGMIKSSKKKADHLVKMRFLGL